MKLFFSIVTMLITFHLYATTTQDAYKMVLSGEAVLVDVREEIETKDGMIKNAVLFPLSKTRTDSNWKKNFINLVGNKKIFLYCRSGRRSGEFLELLQKSQIKSENLGGYLTLKDELPSVKP
jgi:rhodanese-related sulfurtransferase